VGTFGRDSILIVVLLSVCQVGMARQEHYDQEARELERMEKEMKKDGSWRPVQGVAGGVKEATVDSTSDLISETASATAENPPILGTLEGARVGGSKAVEHAAKGVLKVATLGYGDTENMSVEQPARGSDEVTKFKIQL